jgi:predicted hydrolase (HD superfamily)
MSTLPSNLSRAEAWNLLREHNKDQFHLQHALTVEGVMRWFAKDQGFADDEDFWGQVGLLHDIDFEEYPEEHCKKAGEMLKAAGASDGLIHAVVCHGYGLTGVDVPPEHQMEKILFAADELTGLIWSASLMRPSKSVMDMKLKSVKEKFKSKGFAAGCNREVIKQGADNLGWELDTLLQKTLEAMQSCEADIADEMKRI